MIHHPRKKKRQKVATESGVFVWPTYTHSLVFSPLSLFKVSLFRTHPSMFSFFSFLSLSWSLSLTRTDTTRFWMGGGVLRGMSRSVGCEICDTSWIKSLNSLMFGKVCIFSNTHPPTRSQVYPPSIMYHINQLFSRVWHHVKKRWKITQTPSTTRYDIVTTLQKKNCPRRRPPAALQGFCIKVTVPTLLTSISAKPCSEHVHNF